MRFGGVRLGLAAMWLALGAAVLLRDHLNLPAVLNRFGGPDGTMVGLVAVALGAWNAVRWWMARRPEPMPTVRRTAEPEARPFEYNPEFDFTRPTDEEPGGASIP